MQTTLILFSSAAKDGNTGKLSELLKTHYDADMLYLDEFEINPYRYDHRHKDDDFRPLLEKALEYDHLVFVSPVYWSSMTSTMKAFFDRITEYMDNESLRIRLRTLRQKQASLYSTSAGRWASQAFVGAFYESLTHLGLTLDRVGHLDCTQGFDIKKAETLLHPPKQETQPQNGQDTDRPVPTAQKSVSAYMRRMLRLFNGVMAKK